MMLNTKLDKGDWVDYEDGVKFLIRPFPASQMMITTKEEEYMNQAVKMFKYCVVDWEGLEDEETGKPVPCNDKMKQYIFDHIPEIRDFVTEAVSKRMVKEDEESKN